jgi:hypothetical protein
MQRDSARDTLPPPAEELALVTEFERAARVDENDARLAELEKLRTRHRIDAAAKRVIEDHHDLLVALAKR